MKISLQDFNLEIGCEIKEIPAFIDTYTFEYFVNNNWLRYGATFSSYDKCLKHALYYCDPSISIVKIYLNDTKNKNEICLLVNANKILAGIIVMSFI